MMEHYLIIGYINMKDNKKTSKLEYINNLREKLGIEPIKRGDRRRIYIGDISLSNLGFEIITRKSKLPLELEKFIEKAIFKNFNKVSLPEICTIEDLDSLIFHFRINFSPDPFPENPVCDALIYLYEIVLQNGKSYDSNWGFHRRQIMLQSNLIELPNVKMHFNASFYNLIDRTLLEFIDGIKTRKIEDADMC